jgi:Uma2 family endonuclease
MAESVAPARRHATYEDLCAVPDHLVAEIIGGELHTSPRPASPHAHAASEIGADVTGAFSGKTGRGGGPGGWWIIDEPELHLGPDVVVPDLAGWRRERMGTYPNAPFFELAPDWLCEVASPSTLRLDRLKKMPVYAREGVRHVWLVHPLEQVLEAYRLEGQGWLLLGNHGADERVRVEPFDAVEIDLTDWWPPIG